MIKNWAITILVCIFIIGGGIFVIHHPRSVPFDQCSEVYKRYANTEGIEAMFVKDFQINDTVLIDVTMLKALDTNAWKMLKSDFHVMEQPLRLRKKIESGEDIPSTRYIFKYDSIEAGAPNNPIIAVRACSNRNKTITIFHLKKESESIAILKYVHIPKNQ